MLNKLYCMRVFRTGVIQVALAVSLAVTTALTSWGTTLATYPPAGVDEFDSAATVTIDLTASIGQVLKVSAAGPTRVERGAPYNPGDGRLAIDTEIVALELHGLSALGPVIIRESGLRASTGQVRQQTPGVDFPADSFFDVFVEIETPFGQLHNNDAIHLEAKINSLPPWQTEYTPPGFAGVALYDRSGRKVGVITHAAHFVGQKASFSVAPAGPSGLNSATLFDVPTAPRLLPPGLGLGTGDNLDALSYGSDFINYNSDIRFSVDKAALGTPGSAVNVESSKSPNEAHGDEFGVVPSLPLGGSNVQILDENGNTSPPFPLAISDDLDALTEPPAVFVDPNQDGVPDLPVYFSLDAASPTLASIPATAADILMTVGGAAPSVFISQAALGLTTDDNLDAMCLDVASMTVLFSLAPGSPTLGLTGAGPADLFRVAVGVTPVPPPPVFAPAFTLGLLPNDNLNALKCSLPEVDYFAASLAEVTIETGTMTETVKLSGPTIVKVAITPDGTALDYDKDNLDQVQTEIVQLDLRGASSLGPVEVRVRNPGLAPFHGSYGEIEERNNTQAGRLDLPPFASNGTADSFFDVFFEIEIDGNIYHNMQPKRMSTLIAHKPPGPGETYQNNAKTELFNENNQPTGIYITSAKHTPNPPLRLHDFPIAKGALTLQTNTGQVQVELNGLASEVLFTDNNGMATDEDGDGLDQLQTMLVQLHLAGNSSLGPISLRLRDPSKAPYLPSVGELEEKSNNLAGKLDLPPFAPIGMAESFFDIYVEIEIGEQGVHTLQPLSALHNNQALSLSANLDKTPPALELAYESQGSTVLYDESNNPSGYTILSLSLTPNPARLIYLPLITRASTVAGQSSDQQSLTLGLGLLALISLAGARYRRRRKADR